MTKQVSKRATKIAKVHAVEGEDERCLISAPFTQEQLEDQIKSPLSPISQQLRELTRLMQSLTLKPANTNNATLSSQSVPSAPQLRTTPSVVISFPFLFSVYFLEIATNCPLSS